MKCIRLGLAFLRDSEEGQSKEYKSLCGPGANAKKAEFRKQWAETKLKVQNRVQSKMYKTLDETKGTFYPLEIILRKEGGSHEAMEGVRKLAIKRWKMGLVRQNPFTERTEYLYFKRSHMDVFSAAWTSYLTETGDPNPGELKVPTSSEAKQELLKGEGEATRASEDQGEEGG